MSVLLIAEHNNQDLKPFTLNAVTAASQMGEDLHALITVSYTHLTLPTNREV